MPFNYQTLKNLSANSIVNNALVNANIASRSIPTNDIANDAVTSTKLANASVNLGSTITTGSVGVTGGGTGLTSVGAANTVLITNSSNNALEYRAIGFSGMQVFTSGPATWNRPSGVRFIRVKLVAGGGGGGGHGESGGAGGYSERVLDVTSISSVAITIGGGGGGTYYAGAGGDGSATSFGPYLSAGGGHGANRQNQHSGGVSGTVAAETITIVLVWAVQHTLVAQLHQDTLTAVILHTIIRVTLLLVQEAPADIFTAIEGLTVDPE
jgi:hypothetical protein